MKTRYYALAMGIVFLAVGALGFVPGIVAPPEGAPPLQMDSNYGLLLGLFPVNLLHNLVHLLFGLWGVLAYRSFGAARGYAGAVAVIYAVLAVMGLIPALNTTFGLIPLYGNDVWLHAAIALVSAYFAMARRPAEADYSFRR